MTFANKQKWLDCNAIGSKNKCGEARTKKEVIKQWYKLGVCNIDETGFLSRLLNDRPVSENDRRNKVSQKLVFYFFFKNKFLL